MSDYRKATLLTAAALAFLGCCVIIPRFVILGLLAGCIWVCMFAIVKINPGSRQPKDQTPPARFVVVERHTLQDGLKITPRLTGQTRLHNQEQTKRRETLP